MVLFIGQVNPLKMEKTKSKSKPVAKKATKNLYLMTFNEDYADEHDVPALAIFTSKELKEFRENKPKMYAKLGNSGDGFEEDYDDYESGAALIKAKLVKITEVDESFVKIFKKAGLADMSLCSVFDKDYETEDEEYVQGGYAGEMEDDY